jgi:hypothetical protein
MQQASTTFVGLDVRKDQMPVTYVVLGAKHRRDSVTSS